MAKYKLLMATTIGPKNGIVDGDKIGNKTRVKELIARKIMREVSEDEIAADELDAEIAAEVAAEADKADAEADKAANELDAEIAAEADKADAEKAKKKADNTKGGKKPKDAEVK